MTGFDRLLAETREVIAALPEARRFAGEMQETYAFEPPVARDLPVLEILPTMLRQAGPKTAALARAIGDAAPHAYWQQSYTKSQVGAHYLANYGWFNLMSPEGPFVSPDLRISFGLWGQGLRYPRHLHAPEEIYVVVAGGAQFHSDGQASRRLGPGDTRHHPPNVPHGMDMTDAPLLAFAIWKGTALTAFATLDRD